MDNARIFKYNPVFPMIEQYYSTNSYLWNGFTAPLMIWVVFVRPDEYDCAIFESLKHSLIIGEIVSAIWNGALCFTMSIAIFTSTFVTWITKDGHGLSVHTWVSKVFNQMSNIHFLSDLKALLHKNNFVTVYTRCSGNILHCYWTL